MKILINDFLIFLLIVAHNVVLLMAWYKTDSVWLFSIQGLLFCLYLTYAYASVIEKVDRGDGV